MKKIVFIAILLIAAPCAAINYIMGSAGSPAGWNPSLASDVNLVNYWRFETDAGTDTKTNDDLTAGGNPDLETGSYIEGTGCVNLDRTTDWYYITDGNLSAGHPMKSGTGESDFSVAFWYYSHSFSGDRDIFVKGDNDDDTRQLHIEIDAGTPPYIIYARVGYNSGASFDSDVSVGTPAPLVNTWQHVCFSYDASENTSMLRFYDSDSDTAETDTDVREMSWDTCDLVIGGSGYGSDPEYEFDGLIDEVLIFDKVLSAGDCDSIRNGTY